MTRRAPAAAIALAASSLVASSLAASSLAAQPPAPAAPGAPAAADAEASAVAREGDRLTAYFAVPEIPASAILGVASATITRPTTPKDLASSLIDGIGPDGRVRQGLAIEASLGLSRAFRVPLRTYQTSRRARFWSNMLVSLATARASGDTASTDLAWGVRAPIVDGGDPLARPEYTARLGAAMLRCAPERPPADVPRPGEAAPDSAARAAAAAARSATEAEEIACLGRVAGELGRAAADSLWNAPRLLVAYAGSMRLAGARVSARTRLVDRVWAAGAVPLSRLAGPLPFARSTQAIGYVDWARHHAVDTLPAHTALGFGARLNVGSASLNGFAELLGEHRPDPPPGGRRTRATWSAGVEFLAAPGLWLSTGVGRRAQDALAAEKTVVLANVRWGISSKPFLDPDPTRR